MSFKVIDIFFEMRECGLFTLNKNVDFLQSF